MYDPKFYNTLDFTVEVTGNERSVTLKLLEVLF